MAYYDMGLVPLFSSVQFGQTHRSPSNPWAQWQYQNAFAQQYPGGQHGKQYSPGGAVGPALAPRQPGTWPIDYPPGVLGTMQSSVQELSMILEPGVVPRLAQVYGFQIPRLHPARPEVRQMNRSTHRGRMIRSGTYPSTQEGPKLPPPICPPPLKAVETSPGVYECKPPVQCPPGHKLTSSEAGVYHCVPLSMSAARAHPNPDEPACVEHLHGTDCYNKQCAWSDKQGRYVCRWVRVQTTPPSPGTAGPGALAVPKGVARSTICQIRRGGKCCVPEGPEGLFKCIRDLWGRKGRRGNPVITRTKRQWAANPDDEAWCKEHEGKATCAQCCNNMQGADPNQQKYNACLSMCITSAPKPPKPGARPGIGHIGAAPRPAGDPTKPCPHGWVRCPQGHCAESIMHCGLTIPPPPRRKKGGRGRRGRRGRKAIAGVRVANSTPFKHCYDGCVANSQCEFLGPGKEHCKEVCKRKCTHLKMPGEPDPQSGVGIGGVRARGRGRRKGRRAALAARVTNPVGTMALAGLLGRAVKNAVS